MGVIVAVQPSDGFCLDQLREYMRLLYVCAIGRSEFLLAVSTYPNLTLNLWSMPPPEIPVPLSRLVRPDLWILCTRYDVAPHAGKRACA